MLRFNWHTQKPTQEMSPPDAFKAAISTNDKSKELIVYGHTGEVGDFYTTSIDGMKVSVSYGSRIIKLPFCHSA